MTAIERRKLSGSAGIGTKILLPVGAVFILFTSGMATLIGVTSQNNLTSIKFAELERMSGILANNIREMLENAALIAQGLSNRALADTLVLSERTIAKHVENILSKLHFTSRAQIAAWAVEKGLTSDDRITR